MGSLGGDQTVDYDGPPPDPPPTGPVLSSSPEYGPPPRPASWVDNTDDEAASSQEKGGESDGGNASTSKAKDGTGQEAGEAGLERGEAGLERGEAGLERGEAGQMAAEAGQMAAEAGQMAAEAGQLEAKAGQLEGEDGPPRPDSGGSEAPSGAVPLLRDDASGMFRRMATMDEWEDRQALLADARTPPGSGEAALAMGRSLLPWKRLLGLSVPGGWADEYHMPSDPPGEEPQPPTLCKLLTSAWVLTGVVLVFASIGLQWAFCEREYYGRLQVWPEAASNSTSKEYLCVPSFVWTFLVPRLLFVFGYVAIFACIFCLRLPDFEFIIARAYDVITEDRQSSSITSDFIGYCRRDPRVLAFWFVVVHALSLVGSLLGEDIVRWDLTETKPPPSSTLEWSTYITTCVVRLMIDSMIGHCILNYSLSIKYLELMVHRSTWYLQTLVTLRSNLAACRYFFARMKIVERCVRTAQPCTSAALLMAMLRICQVASLVWVGQTSEPKRRTSLAQLPIAIMLLLMVLHHIKRHISLTETWQFQLERGPNIKIQPREPPRPDPLNIVHEFSEEEEKNRATVLWHQIVRQCPQVAGRVMGLEAAHWMYWAVLVIGTLYCAGYYALLKHTPLI